MEKCPQCGYSDKIVISQFSNVMHIYVDAKGGKAVFNTDQEKFTAGGVEYVREDIALKAATDKANAAANATITPPKK